MRLVMLRSIDAKSLQLLTLCGLLCLAAGQAAAQELTNGLFETPDRSGDFPDGWRARSAGNDAGAVYLIDGSPGEDTHTGSAAVALVHPQDQHARWFATNGERIPVQAGQRFRLTAWYKAEHLDDDDTFRLGVEFYSEAGSLLEGSDSSASSEPQGGDTDWQQVELEFTVPAGGVLIRPMLVASYGSNRESAEDARFIVDDVALEPAGAAEPQ